MKRHGAAPPRRRPWAALAILLAVALVLLRIGVMVMSQPEPPGSDAVSYVLAARALREGINPYDGAAWSGLAAELKYGGLPYLYPPLLAVLTIPLSWLPMATAAPAFVLLALLSGVVFCILLKRSVGWKAATAAVFLFLPTWATIYFGQIGFVVAILLLLALQALESRSTITLGISLFMGTLLKVTPAAGILMLMRRQYWRALLAGVAAAVVVILLTLPYASIQRWLEGSTIALRVPWRAWWLASWTGILTYHLAPPYGEALSAILGLTALVYTLRRLRQLPPELALSGLLLLPLLFARVTWGHHAVTALPMLAVLWKRSPGNRLLAAFAWALITFLDFRGLAPALTLCWAACVWPEQTAFLERVHESLSSTWTAMGRTPQETGAKNSTSRPA